MMRVYYEAKRLGRTQADIARALGIDQASVSRIFRGIEPAYPKRGKRIADELGWGGSLDELFSEMPDISAMTATAQPTVPGGAHSVQQSKNKEESCATTVKTTR